MVNSHDNDSIECRSPCVRNCCLDDHDVCLGCGRTLAEIKEWHDANQSERLAILKSSQLRLEQRKFIWAKTRNSK